MGSIFTKKDDWREMLTEIRRRLDLFVGSGIEEILVPNGLPVGENGKIPSSDILISIWEVLDDFEATRTQLTYSVEAHARANHVDKRSPPRTSNDSRDDRNI